MNEKNSIKIKTFTDLKTWQEGHTLALLVYKCTKKFPREEIYSLVDQMRRAATSVTSNIAEGFGRHGYREKTQFFYVAQGSLTELKNQLLLSRDIGYLTQGEYLDIANQADKAHQLLQGLITKTKSFVHSNT